MTWSNRVVRAEVNGHPSLMYADRPSSVGSVVADSARWSEREYLVHGQTRVTFAQHATSVTGASQRLLAAGIRAGDRVGVFAANSPDWVTTFFSILRIGAIAVPFNGWWVERGAGRAFAGEPAGGRGGHAASGAAADRHQDS